MSFIAAANQFGHEPVVRASTRAQSVGDSLPVVRGSILADLPFALQPADLNFDADQVIALCDRWQQSVKPRLQQRGRVG